MVDNHNIICFIPDSGKRKTVFYRFRISIVDDFKAYFFKNFVFVFIIK